ncbi:MAG: metallophosphoesterase [Kofleriaceae bacterium]
MRLAHCSDLHLVSHEGAGFLELANKRWIGRLNLASSRSRHYHVAAFEAMVADLNALGIEHVLCTGDVTNIALRREFEFARGKFDQLALGPTNVTVVPGNHDAYVGEGVGHFADLFGPYAATDAGWAWTAADRDPADDDSDCTAEGAPRWPIVRVRDQLALVGMSTSLQTPWFTAYGRAGAGQLARLARVLADPRLHGKVRIIAIHHPPAGERAKKRIRGLRDHEAFAEVIAAHGADLIVHGHEHRDMTESLPGPAGPVPVRGVVSGTYFHNQPEKTARYRVFELEAGKLVSDYTRIWDREHGTFAPDPGTPLLSA